MRFSTTLLLSIVLSWPSGGRAGVPVEQLVLLDSFDAGTGQLAGAGFDPDTDAVWAYGSSDATVLAFDRTGFALTPVPRPGESANDVDIEFAPEALSLGGTLVPAGTMLFVNGETGTADVYAVDPSDGTVLATLVTAFGNNHVVGGAWHPIRDTLFLVADQFDATPSTIAEIDPATGAVLNSFGAGTGVNFGDLDVDVGTGNLFLATDAFGALRELSPTGVLVRDWAWPGGVTGISGIGLDEGRAEIWAGSTGGTLYLVGFGAPPTTTTSSTTATSVTTTSSTTTTILVDAAFPLGTKLLVTRKKSGQHRLQLIARDPIVAPSTPCEQDGELVVESVGVGAPVVRFPLDAALWQPIKATKPEKGCKYRKGPVVATVQIKTGKMLKVIANADDLGVPLGSDPRPVRIELRHGDARHCFEFGGTKVKHKPDKKLLARKAGAATECP